MIDITQRRIKKMIVEANWYAQVPKEFHWLIENANEYELYVKGNSQHFTIKTKLVQCVMVVVDDALIQFIKNNKIHRHISH